MRIGVIGSGRIGGTLARLLVGVGHELAIANSRGPDSLAGLVSSLGDSAHAASVEDAASFGGVVVVAIPLHAVGELPPAPFEGKVVVDANNYFPARDGRIAELEDDGTTSSEWIAAHLAGARVVKAFNTVHYEALATEARPDAPRGERLAVATAGDEEDAKRQVSELIEQLGLGALDTGSLADGGRLQQPGSPLFNRPLRLVEAERELAALRA